jgi:uncharacterized protein (DUF1330 family)
MAAYLLAICEITNPHDNFKKYIGRSPAIVEKHGGKYLLRGPAKQVIKGELLAGKTIILTEFPSMEALDAFVNDPEYVNEVAPLREGSGEYHFAAYE